MKPRKNVSLLRNADNDFQITFPSQTVNTRTLKASSVRHYLDRSRANSLRKNFDFIAITPHYPAVSSVERYRKFSVTFQILDGSAVIIAADRLNYKLFKLDISEKFLNPDGSQNLALYADSGCHPNNDGYQVWADALLPYFQEVGLTV